MHGGNKGRYGNTIVFLNVLFNHSEMDGPLEQDLLIRGCDSYADLIENQPVALRRLSLFLFANRGT